MICRIHVQNVTDRYRFVDTLKCLSRVPLIESQRMARPVFRRFVQVHLFRQIRQVQPALPDHLFYQFAARFSRHIAGVACLKLICHIGYKKHLKKIIRVQFV